jgi:hypothetical protein
LKPVTSAPDDFNTMFEKEIEALFTGVTPPRNRKPK